MTIKNLVDLNKPAQAMYEKHVKDQQIVDYSGTSEKSTLNEKQVSEIHCLMMFGAKPKDVAKYFQITTGLVSSVKTRGAYRNIKLPYQTGKFKKLGRMWFTYDKDLLLEFYNTLPDELKGLCSSLNEDILVQKTKISKSEYIL